ncbi:glutamate receptor U1-like [Apis dorsata]|uniref:glutamate receptor U1-like n=1 Tax=Apis dorsata TaxID=7462 RepID=UPI001292D498|nr:glutamate receptor U1-like [Apis dorsata]
MTNFQFHTTLLLLCVSSCVYLDILPVEAESILIRPYYVYENLIKGVHDYFNNTCIILFHGSSKLIEEEGLQEMDGLLTLQTQFSKYLHIRTVIMDFHMFKNRVEKTYHHIKRPLFVLLNDFKEIREQFVSVSKWITMAYPTWLLFLRDETRFEEFLSDVYIPFDCVFMVAQRDSQGTEIIQDVYRIGKEDYLRSMMFGMWNSSHGFQGPLLGLYQRRHDLHGHNIRVVAINDPPISRISHDETGQPFITGFFGEVIQLLQQGMNCTFSYKEAETWGVQLLNGSWTGSIRMLLEDEADLIATEMMMSSNRLDVLKFTTPIYTSKCRVYIRRPDTTAVKWNAYLAPFAWNIWNAIALTIVIVTLTIAGIDAFSRRIEWLSSIDGRPYPSNHLFEILFHVFGVFCGQGMDQSLLDPTRMVHLSVHLTAVVVIAAYSAALISYLAIKTFAMPFTTMKGLLEDGSYRFAVVANSAEYTFFQNTSDTVLTIMFNELLTRETDLPVNYIDGLKRVCREKNYAFMTLDNMASLLQGKVDCVLEPLDSIMQVTIAMAVPFQSPYRGIIDTNILLLRDSGILQRLLKIEWSNEIRRTKKGWSSVELEDAAPLLLFLIAVYSIVCLLLLVERLIGRNRERRSKTN